MRFIKKNEAQKNCLPRVRKLCEVLAASNVSSCNESAAVHTSNEPIFKSDISMPLRDSGRKQTGCKLHCNCKKINIQRINKFTIEKIQTM